MAGRSYKVGSATIEIGSAHFRAFERTIAAALPTAGRLIERTTAGIIRDASKGGMRPPPEPIPVNHWPVGRRRKPVGDRRHWVGNSKKQLFHTTRIKPPFVVEGVVGNNAPYAWTIKRAFPYNHQRVAQEVLVKPFRKGSKAIAEATAADMARGSDG